MRNARPVRISLILVKTLGPASYRQKAAYAVDQLPGAFRGRTWDRRTGIAHSRVNRSVCRNVFKSGPDVVPDY